MVKAYNILGEEAATSRLASGVYPYKIQAGGYIDSKKMVLRSTTAANE